MLIYALQSYSSPALGSYTANQTYTVTDAIGNQLIQLGVAQNSGGPSFTAPVDVPLDQSGSPTGMVTKASTASGSAAVAAARKVFVPLTQNHAGIFDAMVAALAVGGSVELPSGVYDLTDGGTNTSPLPVYSGVPVRCPVRPVFQWAASGFVAPDSVPEAVLSGAVLVGDGTFDAFAGNTTALGSPPSSIPNAGFRGLIFENLVFKNVKSAIHIGGTNNSGAWHSSFVNLYAIGTTDFAYNLENWQHITVENVFAFGCAHGQRYACSFPASNLSPGNSSFYHLYCVRPDGSTISTRGIVFESYGAGAELNELDIGYIQCNGGPPGIVSPVTATMSSASANLSVPNASIFNIGDQVFFGVLNTNGFNKKELGQSYFVVARDTTGNTVQVSDTFGGTALMPTNGVSNSTQTIGSYGRPGIELLGWGGGTVKHFTLNNIDLETVSTGGLLLQNATSGRVGLRNVPALGTNQGCSHIVSRASTFKVDSTYEGIVVDADTASSYDMTGCRAGTPIQHNPGFGISRREQNSARIGLTMTEYDGSDCYARTSLSGDTVFWKTGLQFQVQQRGSGETDAAGNGNFFTYSGAGGGSRTLPQITSDNHVGITFSVTNPASSSISWNTSGGQTFNNKAGATSMTIGANSSAMVQSQKIGAAYIWAIIGTSGTVTF